MKSIPFLVFGLSITLASIFAIADAKNPNEIVEAIHVLGATLSGMTGIVLFTIGCAIKNNP